MGDRPLSSDTFLMLPRVLEERRGPWGGRVPRVVGEEALAGREARRGGGTGLQSGSCCENEERGESRSQRNEKIK